MNINNLRKKIILIVLFLIIQLVCNIKPIFASPTVPNITSPSVILIEANSGKVLYEKNAKNPTFPASTTKILTALLAIEHCQLSDKVTISSSAINSVPYSYTTAGLKAGEVFTVEQLISLCLLPSANDAANVLAEHISGSISEFSILMNKKAKDLGCTSTNFTNPSGVHDSEHFTTAADLAIIGQAALKSNTYMNIIQKRTITLPNTDIYPGPTRSFGTSNALISPDSQYYYEYATGLKTGYTNAASYCIVASAHKNDTNLICVILGATKDEEGKSTRDIECKKLFEYGFNLYKTQTVISAGTTAKKITIFNAPKECRNLDLIVKDDITVLIESEKAESALLSNIETKNNIQAPIKKGDVLGKISYTIDGETYSSDLIAANDVEETHLSSDMIKVSAGIVLIILAFKLALMQPENQNKPKKRRKKNISANDSKKKNYKKNTKKTNSKKKTSRKKELDDEDFFDLFYFGSDKKNNSKKNYRKNSKKN